MIIISFIFNFYFTHNLTYNAYWINIDSYRTSTGEGSESTAGQAVYLDPSTHVSVPPHSLMRWNTQLITSCESTSRYLQ